MMKIISSFMGDLSLVKNKCHTITFESSQTQMNFRSLIQDFFLGKKMDDHNYLDVLDMNGNSISPRNLYFLDFNCFSIDLKNEKDTPKLLLKLLEYELEHNAELLDSYLEYLAVTEKFVSHLELNDGDFKIEFQLSNKTIESLLKSLTMTIEYNDNEFVTNYPMRELLIKAMLKLNLTEKEVVLLLSFPEVDIGFQDYERVMKFIKELGVTTIIQSANPYFITYPAMDRTFLVNKNGGKYDVPLLAEELVVFELAEKSSVDEIAKDLAYRDFIKDYKLLDSSLKEFLISDRK